MTHTYEPPSRTAHIDVAPPSMSLARQGIPMRYVPYNGGGVLADWLRDKPARRITVTLGSALPSRGLGPLRWIADAAREIDAEFVLAIPEDAVAPGDLPPNVRSAGYVPLTQLLATCTAVVHHGGSGTTITALDLGIPQLVLPQMADQFVNAEAVRRRGCGLVGQADTAAIRTLLSDDTIRSAAAEVRSEMHAMPSPASVVPQLVALRAAGTSAPTTPTPRACP